MNFVIKLLKSIAFNAVIIVVNSMSKTTYFILTYTTITIEDTTKLFLYYVWELCSFYIYIYIVLDRELQFIILLTKELYCILRLLYQWYNIPSQIGRWNVLIRNLTNTSRIQSYN